MKVYNKLVRDKILDIIEKNEGKKPNFRILNSTDYLSELNIKLQEELKEYLESGEVEELADLEEVLRAILSLKNVSYEEFENIRIEKVKKRGGFEKRIYLESLDD